ncbi:hypothetical protein [Paucibacter soli]|uniref:hypothetical protein n=1 Tax=Paucibacter soli TaxID=3133433 RepID=UPI0030B4DD3B
MRLKPLLPYVLLGCAALGAGHAQAHEYGRAPELGLSLTLAQPGVYGRIEIGAQQMPRVYYPQTVVVQPAQLGYRPVYIYAPEWQVRHWPRHCHHYGACDRPVYFVRDDWVRENYRQEHRHEHRRGHGHGHD